MAAVRPELEALPRRIRTLPIDERGYPVPWFVAWVDGRPEFRAMDVTKFIRAVLERRCWVCGWPLGVHLAFLIGPMCAVNRNTAEPPCHRECAEWSARNCPFLARPHMVRRADSVALLAEQTAGHGLARNPGVACVWMTRSFEIYDAGERTPNFRLGPAESVTFYAGGRAATRAEVVASVESGLPLLLELARQQDRDEPGSGAVAALEAMCAAFERLYPAELVGVGGAVDG